MTALAPGDVAIEATSREVAGGAAVGAVVDAGDQAGIAVGTRVLVGRHLPCGDCEVCRRGGAVVCPHGRTLAADRAPRLVVPARWVVALDAGLDVPGPAAAAIGGDLAIAYAMYVRASIGPREPAVIVGDDAVARFLERVLVAKGVTPTPATAVADLGERPLRVFATTAAGYAAALALAGPRTTLIVRAAAAGLALDAAILAKETTIASVVGLHPDMLTELLALVVRSDVVIADLVHVVALAELDAARAAPPSDKTLVMTFD